MKILLRSLVVLAAWLWVLQSDAWAVSMEQMKLNGFFDLEYEKADGPGNPAVPVGDEKGSFDQYHFNLLLEFPASDTLAFKGHLEFEHGPQISGSGGTGVIKVEWSYAEYLVSNHFRVRGGIALTPFGLYNEIHDATPTYLSVRIPWSIYRANSVGGDHPFFPKTSTGLFVLGEYAGFQGRNVNYVLYLSNGENTSGKNEAEKDDNGNKAVGGRVMLAPFSGCTVGGSYYTGKEGTASTSHEAWGVSAEYLLNGLGLRGEYAVVEFEETPMTHRQVGWYGEGSYAILRLIPFVRYEEFDPEDEIADDVWTEWVTGVAYQFRPGVLLKAEYRQVGGNTANIDVTGDYNEWATAFTMVF